MSWVLMWVLAASVAGLVVCVWYVNVVVKRPRRVIQAAALTALAALVLGYAFPERVEAKGSLHETLAIVFCYGAMLLGMAAQYGFDQARTRDFRFDHSAFFMPIFASPIVFIPLLGIVADLNASGALATPKLMVYLVAFQNGFFWRGYFEAHRQAPASSTLPSA